MKKILAVLAFALLLSNNTKAQFVQYGATLGNGVSYVSDDLLTSSPIYACNIGGYVDYMFTDWKNPWAENIYLRFGLNITRRGTNFEQIFAHMLSVRTGYYHNWYAQIPVIAGFRYEIPQLSAGNYLNFFIGPTINVGLGGRLWDRHVTPGMPQTSFNYDTYVTGTKDDRSSFKNIRRFDVGLILGVGYQWHNFTFDIYMDHGFVALMKKSDVLAPFDQQQNQSGQEGETSNSSASADRNAYTGTNKAYILSIGYQLPINR